MYSYRSFIPGGSKNTSRMISYVSAYNALFPNSQQINCICIPSKFDKNTPGSNSSSFRAPYNIRVAFLINNTKGGKTQFGNLYLEQPIAINYLGRMEGMPGGSGMPPMNRFN